MYEVIRSKRKTENDTCMYYIHSPLHSQKKKQNTHNGKRIVKQFLSFVHSTVFFPPSNSRRNKQFKRTFQWISFWRFRKRIAFVVHHSKRNQR